MARKVTAEQVVAIKRRADAAREVHGVVAYDLELELCEKLDQLTNREYDRYLALAYGRDDRMTEQLANEKREAAELLAAEFGTDVSEWTV